MTTRTSVNFWLDLATLLVMIGLAATGGIIHFVLPAGTGRSLSLFGLDRHEYGDVHFYLAVTVAALLVLHVLLHWSWVCGVVGRAFGNPEPSRRARTTWGVVVLCFIALFLGAGLWWASGRVVQSIEGPASRGQQAGHRFRDSGVSGRRAQTRDMRAMEMDLDQLEQEETTRPAGEQPNAAGKPFVSDHHDADCPAGAAIDGRTTLAAAASICGVSVEKMRESLGLPEGTDSGLTLGRLKRLHGLSIHEVRRLACRRRTEVSNS